MNWKTWAPLALAIVLGLAAMKIARDVTNKGGAAAAPVSGTSVVVLNKDLAPGAQITDQDVMVSQISGQVNTDAVFTNSKELEGRVLTVGAAKGAPVMQTMLAPSGAGAGMQALIPDGMRALTIEINEFSGVAGNLIPGCRVDIVSTLAADNGTSEMMSRTVVQNIKVQALGMRRADADNTAPGPVRSVTLLATPKEAEAIELAVATGRPQLVLRSTKDGDMTVSSGVSLGELRHGIGQGDPFDADPTRLAMATSTSAPVRQIASGMDDSPTSQPTTLSRMRRHERNIKIIRGGVESQASVEEAVEPVLPHWMTNAPTDELNVNTNN